MKSILFIPSYSMRSYNEDKWLLTRDGHANQCRSLTNILKNDFEIDIIIPSKNDLNTVSNFFDSEINLIEDNEYSINILEQRKNFSFKKLLNKQYDIIITGHLEYAKCLREKYPLSKIASILTHGPLISKEYLEINMLNIDASNIVFYNFKEELLTKILHKTELRKFLPMYFYASTEIHCFQQKQQKCLFLSRFNDKNRFANFNEIQTIITDISNIMPVYYLKPNESEYSFSNAEFIEQKNRQHYLQLLKEFEYVVIPYNIENTYSTTFFEALFSNCKVITEDFNSHFSEFYTMYNYNKIDNIPNIIKHTLNSKYNKNMQTLIRERFAVENNINYFVENIIYG